MLYKKEEMDITLLFVIKMLLTYLNIKLGKITILLVTKQLLHCYSH